MGNNQFTGVGLIDTDQFMADVRVVKKELEGIGESVKKISERGQGKGGIIGALSEEVDSLFSTENLKAFASEVVRVRSEVGMLFSVGYWHEKAPNDKERGSSLLNKAF